MDKLPEERKALLKAWITARCKWQIICLGGVFYKRASNNAIDNWFTSCEKLLEYNQQKSIKFLE